MKSIYKPVYTCICCILLLTYVFQFFLFIAKVYFLKYVYNPFVFKRDFAQFISWFIYYIYLLLFIIYLLPTANEHQL